MAPVAHYSISTFMHCQRNAKAANVMTTILVAGLVASVFSRSGRLINKPLRHENSLLAAVFVTDGLQVLTASSGQTARAWDIRPGRQFMGTRKFGEIDRYPRKMQTNCF